MRSGRLIIISGPSGAGKGTLVKRLLDRVPVLRLSVSATTRPPRPGEVDGVHYRFMSTEEFGRLVACGAFLEWAQVHGNRYGTLREDVERERRAGRTVILEIDPQGAAQVKKAVPDAVTVFIIAPSMEELRRRIEARGAESPAEVDVRLRTARHEMELVGTYDHVVTNDDVLLATDELVSIVESYIPEEVS